MDRQSACHAIALEVARTYVQSNEPEYRLASGSDKMAKDMAQKYIDAYNAAESVFNERKNIPKGKFKDL